MSGLYESPVAAATGNYINHFLYFIRFIKKFKF